MSHMILVRELFPCSTDVGLFEVCDHNLQVYILIYMYKKSYSENSEESKI